MESYNSLYNSLYKNNLNNNITICLKSDTLCYSNSTKKIEVIIGCNFSKKGDLSGFSIYYNDYSKVLANLLYNDISKYQEARLVKKGKFNNLKNNDPTILLLDFFDNYFYKNIFYDDKKINILSKTILQSI
ncbi:hypothetical protein EDL98_11100 [Ornithobacterium rhinotracheale]|uniref:hypothetical protein n=1 Tax=Ornithobacterium rhinotracheale TaxID=28251 RepID=UPI00129C200E|nr:hypothetical protein [Ornithobacterium rhinotracheale]MRJ11611.1 hypothetical protein [Ornithobacterium rhinotracheale]